MLRLLEHQAETVFIDDVLSDNIQLNDRKLLSVQNVDRAVDVTCMCLLGHC